MFIKKMISYSSRYIVSLKVTNHKYSIFCKDKKCYLNSTIILNPMTIKEKYRLTIEYFQKINPAPETELKFKDPFELIVAVILSAQCTDKRVNIITPPLLEKYPDPYSMSKASPEEIFEYIKSCTYPNNKAKHL